MESRPGKFLEEKESHEWMDRIPIAHIRTWIANNAKCFGRVSMPLWIPLESMRDRTGYICRGRGMGIGIWDANKKTLWYHRYKFGDTFMDNQEHWDEGPPHGCAKPYQEIDDIVPDVDFNSTEMKDFCWKMVQKYESD